MKNYMKTNVSVGKINLDIDDFQLRITVLIIKTAQPFLTASLVTREKDGFITKSVYSSSVKFVSTLKKRIILNP